LCGPRRAARDHTIAEVTIASVLVRTTMSLDGFIARPDDEMDGVFEHASDVPGALIDDVIATTGAILGGRRGYEVGSEQACRAAPRAPVRWLVAVVRWRRAV
jgi:hypothetical protein